MQQFWAALKDGDWIVLYQHAPRVKAANKGWWGTAKDIFACACEGMVEVNVEVFRAEEITKEVILLVARTNSNSYAAAERKQGTDSTP